MKVIINNTIYWNVVSIKDYQSKNLSIMLLLSSGENISIPFNDNDVITCTLEVENVNRN